MQNQTTEQEQPKQQTSVGKNLASRLLKKGAKKGAKMAAVAMKAFAKATIKLVLAILSKIAFPFLAIIGAIILLVIIVQLVTTLAFSSGSDLLNERGQEFAKDIQAIAKTNSVPADLLFATSQLHASFKMRDDEEDLAEDDLSKREYKKMVRLMKKLAEALTPNITYKTVELKTLTYSVECYKGCLHSGPFETIEEVSVPTIAAFWDKNVTYEYEIVDGIRTYSDTHHHEVCAADGTCGNGYSYSYSDSQDYRQVNNTEELDYSRFEQILKDEPYKYSVNDIKYIEVLYLATGSDISYTEWKEGNNFNYTVGMHGGAVIPGSNIPSEYFPIYLAAQQKFGVGWNYIAAIHWIETKFSTMDPMISYAGAEGHVQFMRCTWHGWGYPGCKGTNGHVEMSSTDLYNKTIIAKYKGYGLDANNNGIASPWEIEDAIFTAAYYLSSNGFAASPQKAIWHYNHSETYVNQAITLAKQFAEEAEYLDESAPNDLGFVRATTGSITSPFGRRLMGNQYEMHIGVDIANSEGTPIYAVADGTVRSTNNTCHKVGSITNSCGGGWGNYVIVTHQIHGEVYETVYAHFSSVAVRNGQTVKAGQLLGGMGTSGRSTGVHLHLELHKGTRASGSAAQATALNPQLYIPM